MKKGKYHVQFNNEDNNLVGQYGLIVRTDETYYPYDILKENGDVECFKGHEFSIIPKSEVPAHLHFIPKITNGMGGVINTNTCMLRIGCQTISFKGVHELSTLISLLSNEKKASKNGNKKRR